MKSVYLLTAFLSTLTTARFARAPEKTTGETLHALERLILANVPNCSTVSECFAKIGTPSTSIAILEDGIVTSRCYSTVGDNVETIFQAASISKAVTAIAIMRLIDEGKFTLDSTIEDLLPHDILGYLTEDSPASQARLIGNITVKQLMSHTAGLSVHGFAGYPSGPIPNEVDIIRGQNPANNLRIRLELLPGNAFSYSGGGFTILQVILESVTGKNFSSLMQDTVLKPLNMTRSFFGELPPYEKNFAKSYDTGYTASKTTHNIFPELAAAGLWSNPKDLLKVVQAVQQSLDRDSFLKHDTAKQMLTRTGQSGSFGLSWIVDNQNTSFGHAGSNPPGFESIMTGFAQLGNVSSPRNSGIVIMTNSGQGSVAYTKVGQAVSYLNKWPDFMGSHAAPFWDPNANIQGHWKAYKGAWTDGTSKFLIKEEGGQPTLVYDGFGPLQLIPGAVPGSMNRRGVSRFVLEGLSMMLQFKEDGKKMLVLENGVTWSTTELKQL